MGDHGRGEPSREDHACTAGERAVLDAFLDPAARWIYVHRSEETARHAGHIDILREQIDASAT